MKGALIVDWDNLRTCLKYLGYSSSPQLVAEALRTKAAEIAAAENAKLDHIEVYASPLGFGGPVLQEFWLQIGYDLHLTSAEPEASRQEIYGEVLTLLYNQNFNFFIIAAGDCDYSPLAKKLETSGAHCYIWLADITKSRSSRNSTIRIPQLLQLPPSNNSQNDQRETMAFEGVVQVIESEIIRRTQRQLEEEARKYSRRAEVSKLFDSLVEHLKKDSFIPDVIIAWVDLTKHRRGSEIVADELSNRLGCPALRVGIREQGERREINFTPDLTSYSYALVVDDANFSGKTMNTLVSTLKALYPETEFRTAVLSSKAPLNPSINYYGSLHNAEDLLFPWGWARTINKFYDLLRQIGIQDKVSVFRTFMNPISSSMIIKDQVCTLEVLTYGIDTSVKETTSLDCIKHETDELLYFINGEIEIIIDEEKGIFRQEEFLFIPQIVPYRLILHPSSILLRIGLGNSQRKD